MLVKFTHDKTEYTVDLDAAHIWVTIEDDLKLTVNEAQDRMSTGSLKVISYAIWVASESEVPFKQWVKGLGNFEIVEDGPKDTGGEVSAVS